MAEDRLIAWDSMALRVRGRRLEAFAREMLRANKAPIDELSLEFHDGEIRVSGKGRTLVPVPFRLRIRRIDHQNGTIRIPLESASAFGFVPVPKFLFHLARGMLRAEGLSLDSPAQTVVIALDRFLPSFVDVTIERIRLVEGGIELLLGNGGADPPAGLEGFHG
ncbi:MAG TPA: hypothetical protein VMT00_01410 [Thermoanaerobaculia bacterium]|nr:hypothetical protein [Thermoanaerobaculia bacterium]